ncbi:putative heparin-binding hemagglutinin [Gordonia soli NBRC 108243]|uniref:Putative heparin-binding hemagglutinin n=1 Tax=Gordonia soli NBRC 108243 TaxID=1223545 RepID=M0QP01_9ACTN|nr:putative heparin-binding hemagglutinin [Gordonia soli NBRC 108243]
MTERTVPTSVYAAVGAGDLLLQQFNEIIAQLRERTEAATGNAQARIDETRQRLNALPEEVPANLEEFRGRLNSEELRKLADGYVEQATEFYTSLTTRGEEAVERLRQQPLVQENLTRAEKAYNDAVDLTEDTLGVVSSQTRAFGERAAKLASLTGSRIEEAGEAVKEQADETAGDISGTIGTVEGKARTAKSSPAKKVAAAKKAPAKKAPAKKAPAKKA